MKVSAISQSADCCPRKNSFISYANSFMSNPDDETTVKNTMQTKEIQKKGLETIEDYSLFQKEVKDGKTIFTA